MTPAEKWELAEKLRRAARATKTLRIAVKYYVRARELTREAKEGGFRPSPKTRRKPK